MSVPLNLDKIDVEHGKIQLEHKDNIAVVWRLPVFLYKQKESILLPHVS